MPAHYKIGDMTSGYCMTSKMVKPFKIKEIRTTAKGGRIAMGMSKEGHKIARILPKE